MVRQGKSLLAEADQDLALRSVATVRPGTQVALPRNVSGVFPMTHHVESIAHFVPVGAA